MATATASDGGRPAPAGQPTARRTGRSDSGRAGPAGRRSPARRGPPTARRPGSRATPGAPAPRPRRRPGPPGAARPPPAAGRRRGGPGAAPGRWRPRRRSPAAGPRARTASAGREHGGGEQQREAAGGPERHRSSGPGPHRLILAASGRPSTGSATRHPLRTATTEVGWAAPVRARGRAADAARHPSAVAGGPVSRPAVPPPLITAGALGVAGTTALEVVTAPYSPAVARLSAERGRPRRQGGRGRRAGRRARPAGSRRCAAAGSAVAAGAVGVLGRRDVVGAVPYSVVEATLDRGLTPGGGRRAARRDPREQPWIGTVGVGRAAGDPARSSSRWPSSSCGAACCPAWAPIVEPRRDPGRRAGRRARRRGLGGAPPAGLALPGPGRLRPGAGRAGRARRPVAGRGVTLHAAIMMRLPQVSSRTAVVIGAHRAPAPG